MIEVITVIVLGWIALETTRWGMYGEDADWWTPFRKFVWPRIHGTLAKFGGYSLGSVSETQYVGAVNMSETELEEMLGDMSFKRNPWAALKRRMKGQDVSEGSWVWRHSTSRPNVLASMQTHVTVFQRSTGGYDIYAHREDNYWVKPIKHLNAVNFQPREGRDMMRCKLEQRNIEYNPDATPGPVDDG